MSNYDRSYVIGPGLHLYVTPNGWYTFDWNWDQNRRPDMLAAVIHLRELIQHGDLTPATSPKKYREDSYRTAEEALDDLCSHALLVRNVGLFA